LEVPDDEAGDRSAGIASRNPVLADRRAVHFVTHSVFFLRVIADEAVGTPRSRL
jgi:hypothetical protein